MSKEIILENVEIIRVDFSCNHHGGMYQPTIWVKVDGRSVRRMRREGYSIKTVKMRTDKYVYVLPVSTAVPYNSRSLEPRFKSSVIIECDGNYMTFDPERDREKLKWIDYAFIRRATVKMLVCKYQVNGREGLKPYLKEAIFHIDRYINVLKIFKDIEKVNMFVKEKK